MPFRTVIDRDRVRQLLRQGVARKYIAERLGTNKTTISEIARQMSKQAAKEVTK